MLLTVGVPGREREALVVAEKAVVQTGADSFVFLIDGESRARRTLVTLGLRQYGTVEVVAGLRGGDYQDSRRQPGAGRKHRLTQCCGLGDLSHVAV